MNKNDIKTLKENYDDYKNRADSAFREELEITRNCKISFSENDVAIYKKDSKKEWHKKVITDWKELTADAFIEKINAIEWEAL